MLIVDWTGDEKDIALIAVCSLLANKTASGSTVGDCDLGHHECVNPRRGGAMNIQVEFSLSEWATKGLDGASFVVAEPLATEVGFHILQEADLVKQERAGDVLVRARAEFKPTRKMTEWLTSLPDEAALPKELSQSFAEQSRAARQAAERVIRIILWVSGQTEEMKPTRSYRPTQISVDGHSWRKIEAGFVTSITFGRASRQFNATVFGEAQQLLSSGTEEPLSNVLLTEAWSLVATSPRSALVLGIASLESCMKRLMVSSLPGSKWLVENIPSPPIESLLRSYLLELKLKAQINGRVVAPPELLMTTIKKAVAMRNRVVHGVTQDIKDATIRGYLAAISDVNCLLDTYAGHTWAIRNMSVEGSAALRDALSATEPDARAKN
jgi:hypothetical protein